MTATPRGSAQISEANAMLQNAGMPALHQIKPLPQSNPYDRVSSPGADAMNSQYTSPADLGFAGTPASPGDAAAYQQGFRNQPTAASLQQAFQGAPLSNARAVPMDENLYQNLSAAAMQRGLVQFTIPDDYGLGKTDPSLSPAEQLTAQQAFRTSPSSLATVTAFQGDDTRGAQSGVRAPGGHGLDLSQIKDPGLRAWAEHHANSERSVIDGENIVTRYLKKNGYMQSGGTAVAQAESPALPSNTPQAEALMQQSFTTGSPDVYRSQTAGLLQVPQGAFTAAPKTDWQAAIGMGSLGAPSRLPAPGGAAGATPAAQREFPTPGMDEDFAQAFKRDNAAAINQAFGAANFPGMSLDPATVYRRAMSKDPDDLVEGWRAMANIRIPPELQTPRDPYKAYY